MKVIDLSKTELISLLQQYADINEDDNVECAICGSIDCECYYVCDKCTGEL